MNDAPKLRFYLWHVGIGMALSTVLMAAILWADPMGLGGLLVRSSEHPLPLLLLWFFCALTFSSVQLGVAIMLRFER
ncbi:hypothetical protein KTR66_18685 [Roseococcus sp. SDR]|uniref:hypothetical protein n=1 Tax=Roseococcus sp. SDR TaxID=2835532 RepID=UPI001BD1517C|nr:hypothetical protein [Roseococcus sp. SDR]MBS7792034.1 hypothetical protein [Roseococcus sp. SDR]MBV1847348.1 hypothetical protein [Roseococcus sp. SDR]